MANDASPTLAEVIALSAELEQFIVAHCDGIPVCCGVAVQSSHDEPPQCCGQGFDLGQELRHLIRTSAASLRDEGWLPIDSAPKDGTRFLGLTSFGVEPVKWHADNGEDYGLLEGWVGTEQDSACLPANRLGRLVATCQPTHWQPLPSPPTQPAAQERQA